MRILSAHTKARVRERSLEGQRIVLLNNHKAMLHHRTLAIWGRGFLHRMPKEMR